MDAWEHFGFYKPPFDLTPDADFYYDAPAHAEALATLQYVVFARKGCAVVVGESGYGKTLMARIVAASAGAAAPVFWACGCGQPDNETRVSVYPAGRFGRNGRGSPAGETTLSAELHVARCLPAPPLLVVDCADELPAHGWRDVIAWLSNELRYPKPVTVLLFGLPRLLETLALPELVRLQGRIFRVCRLERLSPQLTRGYIRARTAAAGGESRYVFSDATIAQIERLGQGNPALINQLCDNALLEAYGEGRDYVSMDDVSNALRVTLVGRLEECAALPAPSSMPIAWPTLPSVPVLAPLNPRAAAVDPPRTADTVVSGPTDVEFEDFVEVRLKHMAARLSQALRAIRQVCGHSDGAARDTPILEDGLPVFTRESRVMARSFPVEAETCW
ncbi:MAG: ExeA family protein [Phycisphaerae bacterium]